MTAPVTMTRVDLAPGHILVDVSLIGGGALPLDEDQAARLRARLADAVEGVFESFWPERDR